MLLPFTCFANCVKKKYNFFTPYFTHRPQKLPKPRSKDFNEYRKQIALVFHYLFY